MMGHFVHRKGKQAVPGLDHLPHRGGQNEGMGAMGEEKNREDAK